MGGTVFFIEVDFSHEQNISKLKENIPKFDILGGR